MRNLCLIICMACICSACSHAKTENGADVQHAQVEAQDAQETEAQPAPEVAQAPAVEPEVVDDFPVSPLPKPLPELASDYWAAPVDGYFPSPTLKNKPIPVKDWECSATAWATCDYIGKAKPAAVEEAYRKQLEAAGFEEGGRGDFYKYFEGDHVRVARVKLEGFGDGGSRLAIAFGKNLDPDRRYDKMPDPRIAYPLNGKLGASPAAVLEIAGNPDKITTYVYEQFNQFFLPNYEKRLENAGYKKDADHSVYTIKYEDGTFLSVAIEPNCYIWSTQETMKRREQACVSMAKGRISSGDTNDVVGLYKNLPDSSIPYPVDRFYQKAYKYVTRENVGGETVFTYSRMPRDNDYIKRLEEAGFAAIDDVDNREEAANTSVTNRAFEKTAADGQKLIVKIKTESTESSVSKYVYDRVTVRMSKQP